jgi:hypothetical protein
MSRGKVSIIIMVLLMFTGTMVSCGGGGGGSDAAPPCTTCSNVAGIWDSTEVSNESQCGGSSANTTYHTYTVTQSGCGLTVNQNSPASAGPFTGSICNNTLSWSGSYPEPPGTTTITSMSLIVSGTTTSTFSGSANWSYSETGYACSGSTQINATKR